MCGALLEKDQVLLVWCQLVFIVICLTFIDYLVVQNLYSFEWDLAFFVASSWMAWCLCGAWLEKDQVFIHLLFKISLMLTNIYLHLFDVYRLFGGTKISILLNEILLSSLLHPEWHGVCVEHDWRRTRYLFIYFLKLVWC